MRWFQTVLFCCSLLGVMSGPLSATDIPENSIIEHGPRNSRKIALTFDACPTGRTDEYDDRVVDVLVREKVPATLFMSGRWVEKNPERAKLLAGQDQFEIAAHSYFHPHMMQKDDQRDLREFKNTQAIIRKVTGKTPRFFRPPYGEVDERVANLARSAGLVTIQYDIASGDPDPNLSAKAIVRGVLGGAKGGSIVVFHMNRNGAHTAEVLPELIEGLRQKGFILVTVGELLQEGNPPVIRAHRGRRLALAVSHPAPASAGSTPAF